MAALLVHMARRLTVSRLGSNLTLAFPGWLSFGYQWSIDLSRSNVMKLA